MPLRRPGLFASLPDGVCRLLAFVLIAGAAALHVVYLARHCPLDLSPDEAHYWDWSRHLDWSYYSKGPLVAWLIRGSCELFGRWSEAHTGSLMFAVRLPAVVCGCLLLVSLYVLTVQVYRCHPLALAVVALALTLPVIAAGASIMTIDAPYTCCWGWALVLGHRAMLRGSGWAWPLAGLAVGAGTLAKYTMVLWLPSAGLFLLCSPAHRRLLLRPGFWILCAAAALCCVPILVWNARHGWITFKHVQGHAGVAGGGPLVHWEGPLVYLGGQCAVLLIYWFIQWLCAVVAHNPWAERDEGVRYLWWLSAPTFLVFLGFSLKNGGGEVNWPVTAYLSGMVLGAAWIARQLESPHAAYRRTHQVCLALACGGGLAVTVLMHHTDWIQAQMSWLAGPPRSATDAPLRKVDPTCRLKGWRTLALGVDEVRAQLRREGAEPVVAGCVWNTPGELGVYCAGHPVVCCLGWAAGDRHSQYDFWKNPFDDADEFKGRTFVVVGGLTKEICAAFERIEPERVVRHYENGHLISYWSVSVCRGFRGFPPLPQRERKY